MTNIIFQYIKKNMGAQFSVVKIRIRGSGE